MLSFHLSKISLFPLIIADVGFGAGVQESAARISQEGAEASAAITEAMNGLWNDVLGGSLYAAIAKLGVFFAIGTLIIFIVQWFKALVDGDYPQAFSEIIWPLIVIVLLSNQAQLLATCTLQLRNVINTVNQTVLTSTAGSLTMEQAYYQVTQQIGNEDVARSLLSQCAGIADPQQQEECLRNAVRQSQELTQNQQDSNFLTVDLGKPIVEAIQNTLQTSIKGWLIAFSIAFQWIVEISFLLTALLGPLAVGGSLLPVGQKAIFAWLTGFFSVGMVKLSFNIIVGLVATLVARSNTENNSMIFAFATGLLAPILSLVLAAGGGMAVFNSLSSLFRFGISGALQVIEGKIKLG